MTPLDHAIAFLGLRRVDGLLTYNDWQRALYLLSWDVRLEPDADTHVETLRRVGRPEVAREVWRRMARGDR